jgi:hypothetical protein
MRRFHSYGPIDIEEHYHAPRKELIEQAYTQLTGENPKKSGHYITVWAPRQTGKTWIMQQILHRLQKDSHFDVLKINLQHLKDQEDANQVIMSIAEAIGEKLGKAFTGINTGEKFQNIFKKDVLDKPLILILDEFDALVEEGINAVVGAFRNIYITRMDERDKPTDQKTYLLHGVALVGVRSVLGIENTKGSPFNVQRSVHIPNLTFEEVDRMFAWYEKESGQKIEKEVLHNLYEEIRGQPGLTCWFGELLTEGFEDYKIDSHRPINMRDFEIVYAAATYALPNNNILNIISKAKEEDNKMMIFEMFQTGEKLEFRFDDAIINALYMNGIADKEIEDQTRYYIRFSCPFVQKRLFNYFSHELFMKMGTLIDPYTKLDNVITDIDLNIPNLLKLYQIYLKKNQEWLFKSVPRRKTDMRIYEAVYHFNLFSYLNAFLKEPGGKVFPEFPTGNGKIDLILIYGKSTYGLELKSFSNERNYKKALEKAARYGKQLELPEIHLVFFVEYIDEEHRKEYEKDYKDMETKVKVIPIFIETG